MRHLFISPHVDDSELMCGATIARLIEENHYVKVLSLSHIYDGTSLYNEWVESMKTLGVQFQIFDFETRFFHKSSDLILQSLFKLGKFDYVYAPSLSDIHSDHEVTAKQAFRAFKHSNLLTYQCEWNNRQFIKNYFVKVEERHVNKKLNALLSYKSQQERSYFDREFIVGSMKVNGLICGAEYAEAYNVLNFSI